MISIPDEMRRKAAGLPAPCMEIETYTQPHTLSVILPSGDSWTIPWSRFARAHHHGEEVTLLFSDAKVVISGQNLKDVMAEAAQMRIDYLRTMPDTYRPVLPAEEPFISKIEVQFSQPR
jgi:hypothetical protein